MSQNKNPYEIRTDVLAMAKDYMDQVWSMNMEMAQRMYTNSKIDSEKFAESFKPYSIDELLTKADELYKFVSNNK
jgi:hypothetical protein